MDFDITFGSTINIISKSNIRYQGIFENFDESTITLSNVKSFGTEDRPSLKKIEPQDKIYKFIRFNGVDISEIYQEAPPTVSEFMDPAILSAEVLEEHESDDKTISHKPKENYIKPTENYKKKEIKEQAKFYKPLELKIPDNICTNNADPSIKSQILPISVVSNKKFDQKVPNNKYCDTNLKHLRYHHDNIKRTGLDNTARYDFDHSQKKDFDMGKKDILKMDVKEFNFNGSLSSSDTKHNKDAYLEKSMMEKLSISNKNSDKNSPFKIPKDSSKKPVYDANKSFFDKLSYEDNKLNSKSTYSNSRSNYFTYNKHNTLDNNRNSNFKSETMPNNIKFKQSTRYFKQKPNINQNTKPRDS